MNESNFIISMYLDNELSLEEKREFALKCSRDPGFLEETLALLEQEEALRADAGPLPEPLPAGKPAWTAHRRPQPMTLVAAGLALALTGLSIAFLRRTTPPSPMPLPQVEAASHRFVFYDTSADRVELAGDFTGWKKVGLSRLHQSGYWELTLSIPAGSHRYTFFIDGDRKLADPTALSSEADDFGGRNSVLVLGEPL